MSNFPFDIQLQDGAEYATGTTKLHRLGQRGYTEDGRVFRYCKASANGCAQPLWGAQDSHKYDTAEAYDCLEATTAAAAEDGDFTLTAVDTNTAHVADWFAEGYAALTVGSTAWLQRIKANTVGHATTAVIFTFYNPLPQDVASGSQIQVFPSIYSAVERVLGGGDGAKVTVCMPVVPVTASYYFWGQTWGPAYGVPSATFPRGSYESRLIFSYDGSVTLMTDGANLIHQRAGYRLFHYSEDPTGALIFFQLELAP